MLATVIAVYPSPSVVSSIGGVFNLSWQTVAGSGGPSNGGNYALSGTVGQTDASSPLSGGSYSLTGGFWADTGGSDWSVHLPMIIR